MQSTPSSEGLAEDEEEGLFAEINITPLTDVFLVLLIILMVVSASVIENEKERAYQKGMLAERAMQIMTPEGAGDSDLVPEDVLLSVSADRAVFIDDEEVPLAELDARLAAIEDANPATRIVLRGDKSASYDVIMDIIARCAKNNLRNIALASQDVE